MTLIIAIGQVRHVCVVGHISAAFHGGAVAVCIVRIVGAFIRRSRGRRQINPIEPTAHIIGIADAVSGGHTVGNAGDVVVIVIRIG